MAQTSQSSEIVTPFRILELICRNGGFSTILQVRPGTHRFHFVVDGEWRISNDFATAVDSEGNLLNYFEAAEYPASSSISCTSLPPSEWHNINNKGLNKKSKKMSGRELFHIMLLGFRIPQLIMDDIRPDLRWQGTTSFLLLFQDNSKNHF